MDSHVDYESPAIHIARVGDAHMDVVLLKNVCKVNASMLHARKYVRVPVKVRPIGRKYQDNTDRYHKSDTRLKIKATRCEIGAER